MAEAGWLLALAAMEPLSAPEEAALRVRTAMQPPAVQEFVQRRAWCNHWSGEEGYDDSRRAQIERALGELRCGTVRGEELFLARHFAARPDIVALLRESREMSGWPEGDQAASPGAS
jgi:hypothetical protein